MPATLTDLTPPDEKVAADAEEALKLLRPLLKRTKKVAPTMSLRPDGERIAVPRVAFDLLVRILGELANGNAVTIVPVNAELTTQQAADLLNVSRPYLIGLLSDGKLPFRMVGSRRRIKFADLVAYKKKDDAEAKRVMDELSAEAQKLGLGY
jgi:excisionase family DNA binding protein